LRPALSFALVTAFLVLVGCGNDGDQTNESVICQDVRALQNELEGSEGIDPDRLVDELDNLSDRLRDADAGGNQQELANLGQITDSVDALDGASASLQTGSNGGLLLRMLQESLSGLSARYGCKTSHQVWRSDLESTR
jgi:hypothetical protein